MNDPIYNFPVFFPIVVDDEIVSLDGCGVDLHDVDGKFVAEILYLGAPDDAEQAEALAFADWVRETLNDAVGRGAEPDEFKFRAARARYNELLTARKAKS